MDGLNSDPRSQGSGARKQEQATGGAPPSAATSTASANRNGPPGREGRARPHQTCQQQQQQQPANNCKVADGHVQHYCVHCCMGRRAREDKVVLDAYVADCNTHGPTAAGTRSVASSPTAALQAAMRDDHDSPRSAPPSPVTTRKSPVEYEEIMGREWTVCELGTSPRGEPAMVPSDSRMMSPLASTLPPQPDGCRKAATAMTKRNTASLFWSVHREPPHYDTDGDEGEPGDGQVAPSSPVQLVAARNGQRPPQCESLGSSTCQPPAQDIAGDMQQFLARQRQKFQQQMQQGSASQQQQQGRLLQRHKQQQATERSTRSQMSLQATARHPLQKTPLITHAPVPQRQQQKQKQKQQQQQQQKQHRRRQQPRGVRQPLLPTPHTQCSQWPASHALQTVPSMSYLPYELAAGIPPPLPSPLQAPIPRRQQPSRPDQQPRVARQPLISVPPQQQQQPQRSVSSSVGVAAPPHPQGYVHVHHHHYVFVRPGLPLPSPLPPVLPPQLYYQGHPRSPLPGHQERQARVQQHTQDRQ